MIELPFSSDQFLGVFEVYNNTIWPSQIFAYVLGVLAVVFAIWEIRATIGNNTFRLLGFFDGSELIVLTSGFAKKTNKVPKQEIKTAEDIKLSTLTKYSKALGKQVKLDIQ